MGRSIRFRGDRSTDPEVAARRALTFRLVGSGASVQEEKR